MNFLQQVNALKSLFHQWLPVWSSHTAPGQQGFSGTHFSPLILLLETTSASPSSLQVNVQNAWQGNLALSLPSPTCDSFFSLPCAASCPTSLEMESSGT